MDHQVLVAFDIEGTQRAPKFLISKIKFLPFPSAHLFEKIYQHIYKNEKLE